MVILTACGGDKKESPVSPELEVSGSAEFPEKLSSAPPENFTQWGTWMLRCEDARDGNPPVVEVIPLRATDAHFDVKNALVPPICINCLSVSLNEIIEFDWYIDIQITNPTVATVYDLMIVFPGTEGPTIVNPSSYTDLFDVDGDWETHHPMCIFETGTDNHEWGPGGVYSKEIILRKEPDVLFFNLIFMITVSYPGPQDEISELRNSTASGILYNDGSNSIDLSAEVIDWQDDVDYVVIDMTDLGGSAFQPLVSDGTGNYKSSFSKSGLTNGTYECLIAAKSLGSDNLTYNYMTIEVEDPPLPPTNFITTAGPLLLSGTGVPVGEYDLSVVGLPDGSSRTLVNSSATEIYEWNEDYSQSSKFITVTDTTGSDPNFPVDPVRRIAATNPELPDIKSNYSILLANNDTDPMDDTTDPYILYRNTLEIFNLESAENPVVDFTLTVDNLDTPELDVILSPIDVSCGTGGDKAGYALWVADSGQFPSYYPFVGLVKYEDPYKDVSDEYDYFIGGVSEGFGPGVVSADSITGLAIWDSGGDSDIWIFITEAGEIDEVEIFSIDFTTNPGGEFTPVASITDFNRTPIDIAVLPVGDAGLEPDNWICILTVERRIEIYTFDGDHVETIGDASTIPFMPAHLDTDLENLRIHVTMQGPNATVFEYKGIEN